MISRRLFSFALMATLCAPSLAADSSYVKLDTVIEGAEKTLIKLFSYDCPFCYRYDTGIDPWLIGKAQEAGLTFVSVHSESKATYGKTANLFLAYCELLDKAQNRSSQTPDSLFFRAKEAMYFAYLKQKQRWPGGEAEFIHMLTSATGISKQDFANHREDADVQAITQHWRRIDPVRQVQGVPAYIVNGKYVIRISAVRSKAALASLVAELAQKP